MVLCAIAILSTAWMGDSKPLPKESPYQYLRSQLSKSLSTFTGKPETGRAIQAAGFFVGVTGIITFNNPSNAELVASLDPLRLLTETDAPFLAPKPHRGKRNEPGHAAIVFQKLAQLFPAIPEPVLRQSILDNFSDLFGIS